MIDIQGMYLIEVHPCDAGNPLLLRLSLLPEVLGHDTTDVGYLQHLLQFWCEGNTRVTHPSKMVVPFLVLLGWLRARATCVRVCVVCESVWFVCTSVCVHVYARV